MSQIETEPEPSRPQGPPLADSMNRVLADPLSALRASMEALIAEVGSDAPHGARLEGALDQVTRLARDVQSLVELAEPRALAPLNCSLEELARSALGRLRPELRERVHYAHPGTAERLWVDGPTLTGSLANLLSSVLDAVPGEVLLRTRQETGRSAFVIVHARHAGHDPATGGHESDAASRCVRLAVAHRDIARMGGEVTTRSGACAVSWVCIELPSRTSDLDQERAA